jgi:hypothetical protein
MRHYFFAASLGGLFLAAGTASADYIRIKVNADSTFPGVNGANQGGGFGPPGLGMGGGPGLGMGGGGDTQGPGGFGMRGGPGLGMGGGKGVGIMGGPPPQGGGFGMMGGPPQGGGFGMGGGRFGQMGGGPPQGGGFGMMGGGPPQGGGFGMMGGGPPQGGGFGMVGGFMGQAGMAAPPSAAPAHYLYVYIEVKNLQANNGTANFEHKWGKKAVVFSIPDAITIQPIQAKSWAKAFEANLKKLNKESKGKISAGELYNLANHTLSHGLTKEFHKVMGDLVKLESDPAANDFAPIIKNYQRVKQELEKKQSAEDPSLKGFLDEQAKEGFKAYKSAHYDLWSKIPGKEYEALANHKLARLEHTFETFYYWFALQKGAEQPPLPPTRLVVVMAPPEVYETRQVSWGVAAPVADGFTPRRDNVLFLSSKRQDPLYRKLDVSIKAKLNELMQKLANAQIGHDEVLSGKIWDTPQRIGGLFADVGFAQTLLVMQRALEEDSERATITYEGTRQLLVGSGMFPRHVNVPDWVLEGLSSYFETPAPAVYPGVGLPSWTHLISFKYFHQEKASKLAKSSDVLYNVLTDRYFAQAMHSSELAQEKREDDRLADLAADDWELARCTAWSFVYHLTSTGRVNDLVNYGKELNQLPRDMDLSEQALQACAARAFKLGDPKNASRIDMAGRAKILATEWYSQMTKLSLEDMPAVEAVHLQERRELAQARLAAAAAAVAPTGPPQGLGGFGPPGGAPPPGGPKGGGGGSGVN